jgi:hypothetical protein
MPLVFRVLPLAARGPYKVPARETLQQNAFLAFTRKSRASDLTRLVLVDVDAVPSPLSPFLSCAACTLWS